MPKRSWPERTDASPTVPASWALMKPGCCIAASHAGGDPILVATSYADRDYFQAARRGKAGHQVAVGGKEYTPSLLFYAPILEHERFIGVVAGSVDIKRMAPWLVPADAILTDHSGAIVLAGDRDLLPALQPSPGDQREQAWNPERFPDLVVMAGRSAPLILRRRLVAAVEPIVTVLWPVANIDENRRQHAILTAMLGAAGTLLLGLGIIHHRWSGHGGQWPDEPAPYRQ